MIKAAFLGTRDHFTGFYVVGHAGYGEYGKDIVCSGVSALSVSAVNALSKRLKDRLIWGQTEGFLFAKLSNQLSQKEAEASQIILDSLYEGMQSVEKQYGKYLKVVLQEV